MPSALGWVLIQGEALCISKNLCKFFREIEGINLRNKKSWWLMLESFFCSMHRWDVVLLELWHCSLGLHPPGRRTSKVPAFTVVLNHPILESECYLGVLVTLIGSVVRRIWIFFSAACAFLFSLVRADAVFPVDHYSVSIWHWPGEVHAFLSRHRVPFLSIASAQYSVIRKG